MLRLPHPRAAWLAPLALLAALALAACAAFDGDAGAEARWDAEGIAETHAAAPFYPQLMNSQRVTFGESRLMFAFFHHGEATMLEHAEVTLRLYRLGEADSEPERADYLGEYPLTERSLAYIPGDPGGVGHRHGNRLLPEEPGSAHLIAAVPPGSDKPRHPHHDGDHATVYTANVDLDRTGWWGAELDVSVDGEEHHNLRLRFWVQERTSDPMIGDPIPPSRQPTIHDVDDIEEIDSSIPPNPELHGVTVAEGLEAGEPMVVAFVTPAFCQVRLCGPVMEAVILPAWQQYGDEVRFIHIEPFDLAKAREGVLEPVEAAEEWGLMVEPIVFVVDRDGRVTAKLEGVMDLEELTEALDAILGRT